MSQLADIEYIVSVHTDTDEAAAALFLALIDALHWDVDGVATVQDAIEYLNRGR